MNLARGTDERRKHRVFLPYILPQILSILRSFLIVNHEFEAYCSCSSCRRHRRRRPISSFGERSLLEYMLLDKQLIAVQGRYID